MWASYNGYLEAVRTLLEYEADINAQSMVRNQMMMTTIIVMMIVIND